MRRLRRAPGALGRGLKRHWRALGLCAACGLILTLGLPSFNLWPVGFFALAPLIGILGRRQGPSPFAAGFIFGLAYAYSAFFWLNSIWIFAPSKIHAFSGVFLLAVYCALYYGVFGWAGAKLLRRNPLLAPLALGALWTLLEWMRSLGPLAFPWAYLAHTQSANLPFIQMADLGGTFLVSFVLAAINVLIAQIVSIRICRKDAFGVSASAGSASPPEGGTPNTKMPLAPGPSPPEGGTPHALSAKAALFGSTFWGRLGVAALLAALPFGYGAWRMSQDWSSGPELDIGISQPNVGQILKFASYAYHDRAVRQRLQDQIEALQFAQVRAIHHAAPQTDLYVLPETSFTSPDFVGNTALHERLTALAREVGGAIFFGADNSRFDARIGRERQYVAAWMVDPQRGLIPTAYNKMRLVPFGESLPFFEYIPFFRDKVLGMGTFDRGEDYTLFEAGGLRFGCGICFESAAPRQMARLTREGAQFLVVITNDAWYFHDKWRLDARGAPQHDALSAFRAIESRRWLARSANTGISRIIDPAGRTTAAVAREKLTFLTGTIHGRDGQTPYAIWGGWQALGYLAMIGLAMLVPTLRPRRQTR